jgi:putative tricarboxylic transport membrane protein
VHLKKAIVSEEFVEVVTRAINRKTLIEAIIIVAFGLVAMVEGLRLVIYKDPYVFYDPVGPGFYVLALSVGLLIVGAIHLVVNYRKVGVVAHTAGSREMRQLFSSIIILVLYLLLISFAGYLVATLLFFLLQFRVTGVTSWRTNVILTLLFTAIYYVIFVRLCEMVFPGGVLG